LSKQDRVFEKLSSGLEMFKCHLEAIIVYRDTRICPAVALWMHHTWDPRFCSDTVGYDHDTLPNKSPAIAQYPKLRGRGEFLEKTRKKPLYKIFGRPLFLKT